MPVNDFTLHGFVRGPDGRGNGYNSRKSVARAQRLIDIALGASACAGRAMDEQETSKQDSGKQEASYDYHRYKQLLAEAVDETKRLELIEIIIREKARDRLEAQRIADRVAMTAMTVARVLGPGGRRDNL